MLGGMLDGLPGGVQRWVPVVVVAVLAVPLAYLAARLLESWRRSRGVPAGNARRHAIAEVGIVAGTVPWLWMILTPLTAPREVNLVPLVDLVDQLAGSAAVAATASVTVEILQYGLDLGRVSSVDDVLLNAAGAGLAALASRRLVGSGPSRAPGTVTVDMTDPGSRQS